MRNARKLLGWKEIAHYLHLNVRTVQRWEMAGLPIHRPAGGSKRTVVAFAEELDGWMKAPIRVRTVHNLEAKVASLEAEVAALKRLLIHAEPRKRNSKK